MGQAGRSMGPGEGSASWQATAVSMLVNLVGAGFVSLPWCFSRASIVPGIVLLGLFCTINATSALLICACAERSGTFSFVQMGSDVVGPKFGRFVQVVTALNTMGTCISYTVLVSDFAPRALQGLGLPEDAWYTSRAFVIAVIAVVILLPLSLQRDLSRLRFSSGVAFAGILFSTGVIAWRGMISSPTDHPRVEFFHISTGLAAAAPVFNVSFLLHYNAPRFYQELRDRSLRKMGRIVGLVFGTAFAVYLTLACFGIMAFGTDVKPDVINNLSVSAEGSGLEHDLSLITRLVMTGIMSMTFPLAMHSLRTAVCALAFEDPNTAGRWSNFLTVLLVAVVCVIAWSFEDIYKVLSYKGALFATVLVYIYPAVTYYKLAAPTADSSSGLHPLLRPEVEAGPMSASTSMLAKSHEHMHAHARYTTVPDDDPGAFAAFNSSEPASLVSLQSHRVSGDEDLLDPPRGLARIYCEGQAAFVRASTIIAMVWGVATMVLGVLKSSGVLH